MYINPIEGRRLANVAVRYHDGKYTVGPPPPRFGIGKREATET
ncbi:MAG: hypothetical protein VB875_00305 [Pirellulales bacterium]